MNELVVVDLDGTLIGTDLLIEALVQFVARNPLNLIPLLAWLLRERSVFKGMLARRVAIKPGDLPYNARVLTLVRERKAAGARTILATASHWKFARAVSAYLGLFDDIVASNSKLNLKGRRKATEIRRRAQGRRVIYIGSAAADIPVWREADECVMVNPSRRVKNAVAALGKPATSIVSQSSAFSGLVSTMRINQWVKNLLVFVPLILSHSYANPAAVGLAVAAFLSFSLCASGCYLLNDLADLNSDRRHATKRHRALPSGRLGIRTAILGAGVLAAAAFLLAITVVGLPFSLLLFTYLVLTTAYSYFIKRVATADVITLSLLYTLRVAAGAVAIGVVITPWLAMFSIFLFVGLAYLKRYVELDIHSEGSTGIEGRDYRRTDTESMFVLGAASTTSSILVFALFINNPELANTYRFPEALWANCVLLLFWTHRVWVLARRKEINEDPVVFASKDWVSYVVGVLVLASLLIAKYL